MKQADALRAARLLAGADHITILCHRKPDGDTLGAGFGLYFALQNLGKTARVLCADGYPALYSFLYGDYVPEDFKESFVTAVDIAAPALMGALEESYAARVDLAIDHHPSNTGYAAETFLDPDASSASELVRAVIRCLDLPLDARIGRCLYTGVATDTGCFRYGNTTPAAHRIAAEVMECGVDAEPIVRLLFETKTPQRVAFESLLLSKIRFYYGGRCAVISTDGETIDRYGLDEYDLEGLSALPRRIAGVVVGVTIRSRDGECRVSVRTNEPADACAVCAAFGGGGHLRAAGCTICAGIPEAERLLVEQIGRQLNEKAAPAL